MFSFSKNPKSTYQDEELLEGFQKSGKLPWLSMLFDRYLEMVYGVCLKYLKNQVEAEDAVMAIFEELIEKAKNHNIDSFRPWLYVLTRNYCLQFLRKQQRKPIDAFDPHRMYFTAELHPLVENYEENPNLKNLQTCLDQLNTQQKACIEQFYYQDKSYKEISEESGIPLGRVRSFIQNGRRNLKMCLDKNAMNE
ncbi:MAG: sigma-70 family RNA polymerase sigma factor [Saprospiraceae bacterium]|nr:sigma-70 family RNA polymerase sigma factor [Saprospiraceae bacterium]